MVAKTSLAKYGRASPHSWSSLPQALHMPRRPQSEVQPQLRRRTELAIKLAHEWLSVMNASQRGLARRLGVDQSVLSRFLSQQPGYEPARNRPRILKLLEDIEQACTHLEDVAAFQDDDQFDASNDLARWEDALTIRLRLVRQEEDPGRALTRFPELSIQALHFPGLGRVFASINACLAAAGPVFREWKKIVCSDDLVRETVDRVFALERSAAEALSASQLGPEEKARHLSRCRSYAGLAIGFAGLRLKDVDILLEGLERQFEAAQLPNEPKDGVWRNLFGILNVLLESRAPRATEFARRAADIGRQHPNESISIALTDREFSSLYALWRTEAPDLLEAKGE